jgi:hypothetical protein
MKISFNITAFILLLFFITGAAAADEHTICEIEGEYITTKPLPHMEYQLNEIWDIYKTYETVGEKASCLGYVDSVYLSSIEKETLEFSFIWEDEDIYLKEGFILQPSGRMFNGKKEEIRKLVETRGKKNITTTGHAGLYYNALPVPDDPFGMISALGNLRSGAGIDVIFSFSDFLGVGGETGFYFMEARITIDGEENTYMVFDIPLRVKGTTGFGPFSIDLFTGVMINIFTGNESVTTVSFDTGIRLMISYFYVEAGYIFGTASYPRLGIGGVLSYDF